MNAVEHEILACKEEVWQRGAWGEDCHQMIGIILADAIGTAVGAAVIIAPGEWGRAIYLLYAITKSGQQSLCL